MSLKPEVLENIIQGHKQKVLKVLAKEVLNPQRHAETFKADINKIIMLVGGFSRLQNYI